MDGSLANQLGRVSSLVTGYDGAGDSRAGSDLTSGAGFTRAPPQARGYNEKKIEERVNARGSKPGGSTFCRILPRMRRKARPETTPSRHHPHGRFVALR